MKLPLSFAFALACTLIASSAFAQLFSVSNDSSWSISSIDPDSGAVMHIANTNAPGVWGSTADTVTGRLFTLSGDPGSQRLTATTPATGNVVSRSIAFVDAFSDPEYDIRTQKILALSSSFQVVQIDPDTGVATALFSVAPFAIGGYGADNHAFDPLNRRLFILSANAPGFATLIVIDIANMTSRSLSVSWSGGGFPLGMEFDTAADRLLVATGGTQSPLIAIDTRTGATTQLLVMNVPGGATGKTAFDLSSRRFFFTSGADFGHLAIVDVTAGTVRTVSMPSLPGGLVLWDYLAVTPVPALTPAGLMLMAAVLIAFAIVRLR
jgi:hypothetical protein